MRRRYYLFFLSILFLSGCFKTDPIEEYFKISSEFSKYTLFQKGSYWVYQKNDFPIYDTIMIDSLVTYVGINGLDNQTGEPFMYDAVEEFVNKPNIQNIHKWEIAASQKNADESPNGNNNMLRLYFENRYNTIISLRYPIGELVNFGEKEGYYKTIAFLDSYEVNGNFYNSVYHTAVYDSLYPNQIRNYNFYIAKYHGIIQYNIITPLDTTVWSVVSWNLSQDE
jgi:hypothetical protein